MQDLVKENGKEIFDLVFNKNGHVYVCGEVKMADCVTSELEHILRNEGKLSFKESKELILKLKEDHRYHEDVFGNNSKFVKVNLENYGA